MRQWLTFLFGVIVLGTVAASQGFAQQSTGVALLIGNAAYPDAEAPLKEPVSDTRALGDELKRRGFDVEMGENLNKQAMQRALDRFYEKIKGAPTALIFFSGFGIQSDRQSYMIPVDPQIWKEEDVRRDGFSIDKVLAEMNSKGARVKIAIIDASRRNPYERHFRSVSAGLAAVAAPQGTIIMTSAASDKLVGDTDQPVFVTELIKELEVPDATIEQTFNRTRIDVSRATKGQQVPWLSSSLEEDVALAAPVAPVPSGLSTKQAEPSADKKVETTPVKQTESTPAKKAEPTPGKQTESTPVKKAEPTPSKQAEQSPGKRADLPPGNKAEPPPSKPADSISAKKAEPRPDPEAEARHDYVSTENLGTMQAWNDFIQKHPSGYYSDLARQERQKLLDAENQRNPNDLAGFYRRGQHHAVNGDFTAAVKDFDEVIRRDPKHAGALNNRCWARAVLDELPDALKDCDEALRIAPNYMDALDSRGLVNLKLGMLSHAIADYNAALHIDPKHASALYGRGIAKLRNGDADGGNKDLDEAKIIQPTIASEFAGYGIK
jgi:hypothetical protein